MTGFADLKNINPALAAEQGYDLSEVTASYRDESENFSQRVASNGALTQGVVELDGLNTKELRKLGLSNAQVAAMRRQYARSMALNDMGLEGDVNIETRMQQAGDFADYAAESYGGDAEITTVTEDEALYAEVMEEEAFIPEGVAELEQDALFELEKDELLANVYGEILEVDHEAEMKAALQNEKQRIFERRERQEEDMLMLATERRMQLEMLNSATVDIRTLLEADQEDRSSNV